MSQTATTMANSKSAKIIEIPEVEEDVEFLYQLEAAEARALSLSSPPSSKRRRLSVEETNNNNNNNNNNYSNDVTVEEGAYTAALKGSKSLTWKKQIQQQQQQNFAVKNASDSPRIGGGGGGGGGGGCFKCGKEGHWARECPQVTSSAAVVGSTLTTAAAVEKACACGLGNCLLLTANTERNRGRKFFRCPVRQENGGCGFFEWCDETPGNRTSAEGDKAWMNGGQQQSYQRPSNQAASTFTKSWNNFDKETSAPNSTYVQNFETNENKGYSMRSDSSCFKCGEQGHWAKDCLTTSSNATAGVRTSTNVTAGVKGTPSSGACFKCGQSGHWARDCTQGQSTMVRNW